MVFTKDLGFTGKLKKICQSHIHSLLSIMIAKKYAFPINYGGDILSQTNIKVR